jgi:hypothetical protein
MAPHPIFIAATVKIACYHLVYRDSAWFFGLSVWQEELANIIVYHDVCARFCPTTHMIQARFYMGMGNAAQSGSGTDIDTNKANHYLSDPKLAVHFLASTQGVQKVKLRHRLP